MSTAPRTMEAWAALHRAHARVLAALTRRMQVERGVSVLEHGSLYELTTAPGRQLRMAELAARLGLSPSATTRLVDRLEQRGWLRREIPTEDRRAVTVHLTPQGRRAYTANNRPFTLAVEQALAAHLGDADLARLVALLERLAPPSRDA